MEKPNSDDGRVASPSAGGGRVVASCLRTTRRMSLALACLILACHTSAATLAQAPAPSETKDADPDRTGSMSRSLSFARDREMETRLRGTHTVFATGRSVDGVRQLAEYLSLPEPHNIQVGTAFRDIREEAARQLRVGSAELREQFRRQTEVRAAGELREALASGDLVALAGIVARYPFTPVARESVETLAIQFYDHGRLDEVIQTAQRWIERSPDPQLAARQSPQLVALCFAALQELGAVDLAAQWAAKYPLPAESIPFRIATPPPITPGLPVLPTDAEVAWDVTSELSPSAQLLLRKNLNDLSRQGVQASLAMRPLILADRIVWRSLTEILCIHRSSGEVLWRKPIAEPSIEAIAQLGAKADPNLERRLRMELGHRVLRNSILGQLTTDGQRVYCIEAATFATQPPQEAAVPNAPPPDADTSVPETTVVAYSLADGSIQWKSHEVWGAEHRGTFLFGAPTLNGTTLYTVVQQRDQLLLLRMDAATGALDGASVLGDAPRLSVDPRRLTQACPIVWHNGLAICATGAGGVAAFDVFNAQLSWGFRHSRDDVDVAPGLLQPPVDRYGWSWTAGWQTPQLLKLGTQLIYASPETNRIRCLDVDEGQLLWEVPIAGARSLVGGDEQRVVIAGSGFVRSLRLADGSVEREYQSSVPIVSTAWERSVCQLALRDGGQIAWSPVAGVVSSSAGDQLTSEPLLAVAGSLSRIQGANERFLIRQEPLGGSQLTVRVNGLSLLPSRGEATATEIAAVPLLPDLDGTARDPLTGQPLSADWLAAENAYRSLRRAIAAGDSPALLRHGFQLLELHPETWEVEVLTSRPREAATPRGLESTRTIRLDALLCGVLQEQWDQGTPDQRSTLLQAFQLWAALPATQRDDLARPLEQLSFLPPRSFERPFQWKTLSELAIQQLELRRRSANASRPAAAAALWRLAELHIARGDWGDAANLIEQLQRRFGEVAIRGGQTAQQVVKSLPANSLVLTRLDADRRTAWPDREPVVTSKEAYRSSEYQVPIPIRAERGTMFDHLNVTYAPIGPSQLRYSGLGKSKPWTLPLHKSDRIHRQSSPELRQGWAFGQFVVVQVGTELFCVSCLNEKGETTSSKKQNTILWPAKLTPQGERGELVDTLGNEENSLLSFERRSVAQVVGFIRPESELFDAHGHRTAWVGPVTAGTTCFLQQGMLVCLETATGQELWRRYNMPSGVRTFGDDRVIVIMRDEQPTIDLLSPLDGQTLRSYSSEFLSEEVLKHWGRLALVATGQPAKNLPFGPADKMEPPSPAPPDAEPLAELRLRMVDLSGPTTLWDRPFPPGSAAFEIDEDWIGVLSAESQLLFLDLRTGQTIHESKVEVPPGMQQLVTAVTERTIYVSLSAAVTEKRLINASPNQSAPGWRRAFVNGPVHAFDRLTGAYQWTSQIENRTLPLDQVRDVPLLLCVDTWKESSESQNRYWCLDARTGKVVLDTSLKGETPQYTVERDLAEEWVELRLGYTNHRFSYAPVPAPAEQ